MKIRFILLCCLFVSNLSFAQVTKRHTFKKIGWTIDLPGDFVVTDSSGSRAHLREGVDMVENINDIKLDTSEAIVLIVANKNENYFSSMIIPFNPAVDGDWLKEHEGIKVLSYNSVKEAIPNAVIDTSSSGVTLDGVKFDKFTITVSMDGKIVSTTIFLGKLYKGYDLGITYSFSDEKTKDQIETMLSKSIFKK